ncbi:C40 family peptidase [Paenibacillus senegalensis]|uniref:C40 family peptidase n=1 Tax=Paenibacillus senegalensis TaxID=1465766 RepID=UPI001F359EE0|nr:NlpC/P60 family protein [Paenibacillus senegalensis]
MLTFTEGNRAFIDENGTTMVPVRAVAERLGLGIDWELVNEELKIYISNDDVKVELVPGNEEIMVNGNPVLLDSSIQQIEGQVYAPVRFISETFGYMMQWDDVNLIAIISLDGQYHAPAWYNVPEPEPQVLEASVESDVQDQIISTAKEYIGTRYVYGGSTPKGFDCSGFTSYVFNQYGVSLPRTSAGMYSESGQSVSDLQKGDLVFFANNGRVFHVGIYIENNQFISATTSYGVKIDKINDNYWGNYYIGAKRVL